MKAVRMKILFSLLLFSAAVPSIIFSAEEISLEESAESTSL